MKNLCGVAMLILLLLPEMSAAGDRLGRLDSVYKQLVGLDTHMFPPEEWSVTDVRVIREILYQVRNSNRLPESAYATLPHVAEEVEVICQKRLFDDELERLLLCYRTGRGRDTAEVQDYVLIRSVLGGELYDMVKGLRGSGKDDFEKDLARVTDLYLHPLRPSLQIWSTQPRGAASYHSVALFGRLGNDALDVPLWYRGTMLGGVSLTYIDRPSGVRDPDYASYRVGVGIEEPINFCAAAIPSISNAMFRDRRLEIGHCGDLEELYPDPSVSGTTRRVSSVSIWSA
jgi:hypothetical protein